MPKTLGQPGRKGDDEAFLRAGCKGGIEQRIAGQVGQASCPPAALSSPGGPEKGHITAPGELQSAVVPAWPRDPAGSSLLLHLWKTLQAGVGAQKTVLLLTPGGAQTLEGRCLSWQNSLVIKGSSLHALGAVLVLHSLGHK